MDWCKPKNATQTSQSNTTYQLTDGNPLSLSKIHAQRLMCWSTCLTSAAAVKRSKRLRIFDIRIVNRAICMAIQGQLAGLHNVINVITRERPSWYKCRLEEELPTFFLEVYTPCLNPQGTKCLPTNMKPKHEKSWTGILAFFHTPAKTNYAAHKKNFDS